MFKVVSLAIWTQNHITLSIKIKLLGQVIYVFNGETSTGQAIEALPSNIVALLPTDAKQYSKGGTVVPISLSKTEIRGLAKKGTWAFKGWSPEKIVILEKLMMF